MHALLRTSRSLIGMAVVFLAATHTSGVQTATAQSSGGAAQATMHGSWSSRSASGLTLMGTWTAVPDTAKGIVIGTWTLLNPLGDTLATGAWSAAKEPAQWYGAWRAVVAGRPGEYSGTWTAAVDIGVNGSFVDLFNKALQTIVSGGWRAGGQSGAWSIRTFEGERRP